jgi:ABC-type amino acid transport substrate-binding protein
LNERLLGERLSTMNPQPLSMLRVIFATALAFVVFTSGPAEAGAGTADGINSSAAGTNGSANSSVSTDASASTDASTSTDASVSTSTSTSTLDRIKATKTLRIAYAPNAYPMAFKDEAGVPSGYSIDLCRQVVIRVQRALGLDALEIDWIEGNTPDRVAAVAAGEADIDCGTTTMNLSRQQQVDFSYVVFVESGGILVKSDRGLRGLADLAGRRLGVVPETTTDRRLRSVLVEQGVELERVPIRDTKEGVDRLNAGQLDAVAGDRVLLVGQIAESGKAQDFAIVDAAFSVEPYAFSVPRNDADFRLEVNRTLAQVYRSGEVEQIFSRWFGEQSVPTRLLETLYFIYGLAD